MRRAPATHSTAEPLSLAINASGVVAGYDTDANSVNHGFVRRKDGVIAAFDAPGASNAPGEGTFANSINASGAAGSYSDASGFPHGFVRRPSGAFTSIDAPGESYGTVLLSISDTGAVAGYHTAPIH